MKYPKDLTGMKFGKLTVLSKGESGVTKGWNRYSTYICLCECGNTKQIKRINLLSGNTTSCGCLHKEKIRKIGENNKKSNTYNLSGKYGIGYTSSGEEFYFDLEDYEKIKKYTWNIADGYVVSDSYKATTRFHRLIMNCDDRKFDIDHINHNTTDNRKSNLRIVTRSQNQMNTILRKNNTSGVKGVIRQNNKWTASIQINKSRKHLGTFENFEEAVKVRKEAEKIYFGEYAFKEVANE